MAIFENKFVCVVLDWRNLTVFTEDNLKKTIDFPKSLTSNSIVHKPREFRNMIITFWKSSNLEDSNVILLLPSEMIFQKVIDSSADLKDDIDDFISKIPFEDRELRKIIITQNNRTIILASHKSFYEFFINAITKENSKVLAVFPETFVLSQEEKESKLNIDPTVLLSYIKSHPELEQIDFLSSPDSSLLFSIDEKPTIGKSQISEISTTVDSSDSISYTTFIAIVVVALVLGIVLGKFVLP